MKSETATVYVLGSIHVARPSLYPLSPVIEEAFERSSVLVMEVDPAETRTERFQQQLLARGFYHDGKTLREELDQETLTLLERFLRKYHLPLDAFLLMKPGMVAISLANIQMQAMGFSPEQGIERHFEQRVRGAKTIESLETVEQQLALIADMPKANAMLKYSLLDMEQAEQMIEQLFQAWREGDTEALEQLTLTPYEDSAEFQPVLEAFFYERNRRMAEGIREYLAGNRSCFVVVGAGHLLGRQGVIELLRESGVTATRH